MAGENCAPLVKCTALDGTVVFQRTAYGPELAGTVDGIPFGALQMRGAAIRPYVDTFFQVQWTPGELCYGPISSVMTLAPGETVTIATRTEDRTSFTSLMRDATDSSTVSTHTRQGPDQSSAAEMSTSSLSDKQREMQKAVEEQMRERQDAVELRPMYAKGYGSFWSDLGDGLLAVATGGASLAVEAAAKGANDLTKNAVGSQGNVGTVVGATVGAIAQVVDSVERRSSQSHLSETTHSTEETTTTSVTRTFTNPYRDRTMQLRFMPVFRQFDVITSIHRARLGLAMVAGHLDFDTPNVGSRYAHVLTSALAAPTLERLGDAAVGVRSSDFRPESGELQDHLQANAAVYTKHFLSAAMTARDDGSVHGAFATLIDRTHTSGDAGDIAAGLSWSESDVRANVVHVPLADEANVQSAWKLAGEAASNLSDAVKATAPATIGSLFEPIVRTVHLYVGSHMEAVPGECVLPDIVTDALDAMT
jgi:hypothetical protein